MIRFSASDYELSMNAPVWLQPWSQPVAAHSLRRVDLLASKDACTKYRDRVT